MTGQSRLALGAILLLGMGLRLYGFTWGFPVSYHYDEGRWIIAAEEVAKSAASGGSILPAQSSFRTLPLYLALAGSAVVRGLCAVVGQPCGMEASLLVAGRLVSALADGFSLLLVFALGRLWIVRAGLWAAGLYAVALVAVREAHFFTLEPLATCLMLLYIYAVALVAFTPNRGRYAVAGLALGLALSVRMFALPLAALVLYVLWRDVVDGMSSGGDRKPFVMKRSARALRGWLGGLAFVWILPVLVWGVRGEALKAYTRNALTSTVTQAKLEAHSVDFWRSQVESVYRGGALVLGLMAVAGTGGSLLALHLLTIHRGPRASFEAYARVPRLGAFAGAALVSFLALNPGAVVSPFGFWAPSGPDSVTWDMLMTAGVLQPPPSWAVHFVDTYPFAYQFLHVWPYAWGPPLMALLLLGLGWGVSLLLRGRAGRLWAVAFCGAVLFLLVGAQWVKLTRSVLPLTPVLCVLAGSLCASLSDPARGGRGTSWRWVMGLAWVASLAWCVAYVGIYGRTDTRVQATEWVRRNVADEPGLYELDRTWSPECERTLLEITGRRLQRYNPAINVHDYLEEPAPPDVRDEKRGFLMQMVSDANYILITDANQSRLGRSQERFPVITALYDDLWSGRLGFEKVASFEDSPSLPGLRIDDSGAEPSFRYEDHPRVFIFQRVRDAAAPEPATLKLPWD